MFSQTVHSEGSGPDVGAPAQNMYMIVLSLHKGEWISMYNFVFKESSEYLTQRGLHLDMTEENSNSGLSFFTVLGIWYADKDLVFFMQCIDQ